MGWQRNKTHGRTSARASKPEREIENAKTTDGHFWWGRHGRESIQKLELEQEPERERVRDSPAALKLFVVVGQELWPPIGQQQASGANGRTAELGSVRVAVWPGPRALMRAEPSPDCGSPQFKTNLSVCRRHTRTRRLARDEMKTPERSTRTIRTNGHSYGGDHVGLEWTLGQWMLLLFGLARVAKRDPKSSCRATTAPKSERSYPLEQVKESLWLGRVAQESHVVEEVDNEPLRGGTSE